TYSSLNAQFMEEYQGAMDKADIAVVFYAKHALELKRMPDLPVQKIYDGFNKDGLLVMNDAGALWQWLQSQSYSNASVLLMSSGNYDGLDMLTFANEVTSKEKTK
ncbi:MAG: peptidoglycan synthetase, partial [Bacteroidota bacterium]